MSLPGGVLFCPRWQARDDSDNPIAGAKLYSFTTGAHFTTPQALYTNSGLTIAHTNPVVADANGVFAEMFMLPQGYDLKLTTSAGVQVRTAVDVEDIGASFLTYLGQELATGSTGVASGYTVLASDNYVETAAVATNPFILNLQAASARTFPLIVKHKGTGTLRITPNGSDTIDGLAAYYSVTAATSPTFYTKILLPLPGGTGYVVANV